MSMELQDVAVALEGHEHEIKSLKHRMVAVEEGQRAMNELATSVKLMAEEQKNISAQEAYSMGAAILQKQKLNQSKILSVKLCYSHKKHISVEEENEKAVGASASIIPCWEICFGTDVSGTNVNDYLYLDAVTGLEVQDGIY